MLTNGPPRRKVRRSVAAGSRSFLGYKASFAKIPNILPRCCKCAAVPARIFSRMLKVIGWRMRMAENGVASPNRLDMAGPRTLYGNELMLRRLAILF